MYIRYYDSARHKHNLVCVEGESINYNEERKELGVERSYSFGRYDDNEEGLARFNDLVDALNSGNVIVYDVTQKVGYWKPKHTTRSKPGPKPKTQNKEEGSK